MTKVLIVDDKKMVRDCIKGYLQSAQDRYCVAGEITNASMAEEFCLQKSVDLIIMDVRTEGDADGIQATAAIKETLNKSAAAEQRILCSRNAG